MEQSLSLFSLSLSLVEVYLDALFLHTDTYWVMLIVTCTLLIHRTSRLHIFCLYGSQSDFWLIQKIKMFYKYIKLVCYLVCISIFMEFWYCRTDVLMSLLWVFCFISIIFEKCADGFLFSQSDRIFLWTMYRTIKLQHYNFQHQQLHVENVIQYNITRLRWNLLIFCNIFCADSVRKSVEFCRIYLNGNSKI